MAGRPAEPPARTGPVLPIRELRVLSQTGLSLDWGGLLREEIIRLTLNQVIHLQMEQEWTDYSPMSQLMTLWKSCRPARPLSSDSLGTAENIQFHHTLERIRGQKGICREHQSVGSLGVRLCRLHCLCVWSGQLLAPKRWMTGPSHERTRHSQTKKRPAWWFAQCGDVACQLVCGGP